MILHEGDPAPDFSLLADDGSTVTLTTLRGAPAVLYFYPKDDTPGCTTESCEFRDAFPRFSASGATIIGVSPDSMRSHVKFKEKYKLPFTLLADEAHQMAEAYGVWKEKSMFGRKYMGVERTTFILGPDGRIARLFAKVTPEGHAAEVEEALGKLTKETR
jgi:peroxiredoxin Q/BCP